MRRRDVGRPLKNPESPDQGVEGEWSGKALISRLIVGQAVSAAILTRLWAWTRSAPPPPARARRPPPTLSATRPSGVRYDGAACDMPTVQQLQRRTAPTGWRGSSV